MEDGLCVYNDSMATAVYRSATDSGTTSYWKQELNNSFSKSDISQHYSELSHLSYERTLQLDDIIIWMQYIGIYCGVYTYGLSGGQSARVNTT